MTQDINKALDAYKAAMIADYADFSKNFFNPEEAVKRFSDGISFQIGKKYIKVVTGNSVHSFIVNVDNDKQFQRGDILKSASWSAPARNQARGNVFGDYKVNWTGAQYL